MGPMFRRALRLSLRVLALTALIAGAIAIAAQRVQMEREVTLAREGYRAAKAERDATRAEVQRLQHELASLTGNSFEVEADIRAQFRMVRPDERLVLVDSENAPQ